MNLVKSEQFVNNIKHDLPEEKENVQDLKNTLMALECKYDKLIEKSREKDELIHRLKRKVIIYFIKCEHNIVNCNFSVHP